MKRYSFCITSTTYATNDTTIIYHVYKPDFSSRLSLLPKTVQFSFRPMHLPNPHCYQTYHASACFSIMNDTNPILKMYLIFYLNINNTTIYLNHNKLCYTMENGLHIYRIINSVKITTHNDHVIKCYTVLQLTTLTYRLIISLKHFCPQTQKNL